LPLALEIGFGHGQVEFVQHPFTRAAGIGSGKTFNVGTPQSDAAQLQIVDNDIERRHVFG